MWIAKPLSALTANELLAWSQVSKTAPIAQTLDWGRAIAAVGGSTYLVFSPEENVGGLVFSTDRRAFECINGPLLSWDSPSAAPRQLATFAMAVSKLAPTFSSLTLRPRWDSELAEKRLSGLPIALAKTDRAATWVVPVAPTNAKQEAGFTRRFRRTLRHSQSASAEITWVPLETPESPALTSFVEKLRVFAKAHQFFAPELPWFKALIGTRDTLRFFHLTARTRDRSTQLLIALHGPRAHYLFGFDEASVASASRISTAALAHLRALEELRRLGVREYDLNGFAEGLEAGDSYFGVCEFKRGLGGSIERYVQPVFEIS